MRVIENGSFPKAKLDQRYRSWWFEYRAEKTHIYVDTVCHLKNLHVFNVKLWFLWKMRSFRLLMIKFEQIKPDAWCKQTSGTKTDDKYDGVGAISCKSHLYERAKNNYGWTHAILSLLWIWTIIVPCAVLSLFDDNFQLWVFAMIICAWCFCLKFETTFKSCFISSTIFPLALWGYNHIPYGLARRSDCRLDGAHFQNNCQKQKWYIRIKFGKFIISFQC